MLYWLITTVWWQYSPQLTSEQRAHAWSQIRKMLIWNCIQMPLIIIIIAFIYTRINKKPKFVNLPRIHTPFTHTCIHINKLKATTHKPMLNTGILTLNEQNTKITKYWQQNQIWLKVSRKAKSKFDWLHLVRCSTVVENHITSICHMMFWFFNTGFVRQWGTGLNVL